MVGRESDKIVLRVPDGMRERIKDAAAESGRSMNAEIVAALEFFFPEPDVEEEVTAEVIHIFIHAQNERDLNKGVVRITESAEKSTFSRKSMSILESIYNEKREQLGLQRKAMIDSVSER